MYCMYEHLKQIKKKFSSNYVAFYFFFIFYSSQGSKKNMFTLSGVHISARVLYYKQVTRINPTIVVREKV